MPSGTSSQSLWVTCLPLQNCQDSAFPGFHFHSKSFLCLTASRLFHNPLFVRSFRPAVNGWAGCSLNKGMQPSGPCFGARSAQRGYLLFIRAKAPYGLAVDLHSFNNENKHLFCPNVLVPAWVNRGWQGKDMSLGENMEQENWYWKGVELEERKLGGDVKKRRKKTEDTVLSRQWKFPCKGEDSTRPGKIWCCPFP